MGLSSGGTVLSQRVPQQSQQPVSSVIWLVSETFVSHSQAWGARLTSGAGTSKPTQSLQEIFL